VKKLWVLVPVLLLAGLALTGCGQSAEKLNNEGNEAFASQEYEAALAAYHQATEDGPELAEPHYNAANAHYRLEDYEQAKQEIEQALVGKERQEDLDHNSYYNLANTFFQGEQYQAAIEAYTEALRLNPDDLQAKQNLELALRRLQQQQDQEDQQDQDQQDQQQKGQQDQDPQDQQQNGQQDQQRDGQQQDEQQQDGQQDQNQLDQQQDDPQDQDQPDQQQDGSQRQDVPENGRAGDQPQSMIGLTREQARRLFEAAAQGTESLEEFLQQILVFPGAPPAQDW
jgi:Ca-activated chloride channel family protein